MHRARPIKWMLAVAMDWLIVVAAMAFVGKFVLPISLSTLPLVFLAVLVIGGAQHRLGILGHDGAHRLATRGKKSNDFVTCVFVMWPLMMSLAGYRKFHFGHHTHLGTECDPEKLHTDHALLGQWNPPANFPALAMLLVCDLLGGGVPHIAMAAILTAPDSKISAAAPILFNACIAIAFCSAGLWWVPAFWFLSLFTGFWFWFRIRMWTEHAVGDSPEDHTYRFHAPLWMRLFVVPHNTWYHWEHHVSPSVSLFDLPIVRANHHEPEVIGLGELIARLRSGGNR